MTYEKYLQEVYFDPSHPAAFSGVDKLYRAVRKEGKYVLGKAKIRKWLEKQEPFTLHRQINRKFKKRKVIVPYLNYQWAADTANMTGFIKSNEGYSHFLLAINVFSRYVWTVALKSTKGKEMVDAFRSIFVQGNVPERLETDKGTEYCNREMKKFLLEKGIKHFVTQNESKSSHAERAIKTIKSRITRYMTLHQSHRWIDILQPTTKSYNATYHRSIKMAPKSVKKEDEQRLWKLQYNEIIKPKRQRQLHPVIRYKFKVGDHVRLSYIQRPFDREYDERWTNEYFIINDRTLKEGIPIYKVKDIQDEEIKGTFYESELKKISVGKDTVYRVEKVLRSKGNQIFVKWWGWSKKFNSYIPKANLKDYKKD